ncbi:MAG: hypothetical protein H6713_28445 [Myxococcales bacterium]|nr:hypothetical protein [Myxococcales bacterium]
MSSARLAALALTLALTTASCTGHRAAAHRAEHVLVLDYDDFGPQAAAYELLGMEWFVWSEPGGSGDGPEPPDPIRVVVYDQDRITLAEVQARFPARESERQDFRYVSRADAIAYLDELAATASADIPTLARRAYQTRGMIVAALGR